MTKDELKQLLKDNLEISIDAKTDNQRVTIVSVKVTFEEEEVCKDATLIFPIK
jgi:hypothetical protein